MRYEHFCHYHKSGKSIAICNAHSNTSCPYTLKDLKHDSSGVYVSTKDRLSGICTHHAFHPRIQKMIDRVPSNNLKVSKIREIIEDRVHVYD